MSINLANLNNIKIDGKSYKIFLVYYIGCVTIKDLEYMKIKCLIFFYLTFNKANEYFEDLSGYKCSALVPTN